MTQLGSIFSFPVFPLTLPRWDLRDFEYVITGTLTSPFRARGVNAAGELETLCVKPLRRTISDGTIITGEMACAEILAGLIGQHLKVEVAEVGLAWISPEFVRAAGKSLDGVRPGWAPASRWIDRSFPLTRLTTQPGFVTNPESVAGLTVLDTVIGNFDRHHNVLLQPAAELAKAFALRYIDHGCTLGGFSPDQLLEASAGLDQLTCYVPEDALLTSVVDRQEMFMSYLMSAETLDVAYFHTATTAMLELGWDLASSYPDRVAIHLSTAARLVRPSVMNAIEAFPNCR